MKNYTKEQKEQIGQRIAEVLYLKPACHEGQFATEYGSKSGIGIFETILNLAEMIRDGSIEGL